MGKRSLEEKAKTLDKRAGVLVHNTKKIDRKPGMKSAELLKKRIDEIEAQGPTKRSVASVQDKRLPQVVKTVSREENISVRKIKKLGFSKIRRAQAVVADTKHKYREASDGPKHRVSFTTKDGKRVEF